MIQMQTQAMIHQEQAQSIPDKKVECVTGSAKCSQEQIDECYKDSGNYEVEDNSGNYEVEECKMIA